MSTENYALLYCKDNYGRRKEKEGERKAERTRKREREKRARTQETFSGRATSVPDLNILNYRGQHGKRKEGTADGRCEGSLPFSHCFPDGA